MFAMNVAPSSMQYTLVGFFTELDWRPLLFVKPLPPNRICGACGLVRPKTMLLPCAHSLCQPCYDQCAQEGFHTCPFDSHKCQDEDVIPIVFSADELLRREVKCWNEGRGCEYVAAVSRISRHFHLECAHHWICCTKCSASVPCNSVIAHLKSGLCNSINPPTSDWDRQSGYEIATPFDSALKGTFEKQVCEVKEFVRKIFADMRAHGDY
ncbi:E3 ubiquitin-protein ligase PDZRN3-B-like [Amblyomma americanum]